MQLRPTHFRIDRRSNNAGMHPSLLADEIPSAVQNALASNLVVDMHTHLYPPRFGTPYPGRSRFAPDPRGLFLWGTDELLSYHYLIAEVFRVVPPSRLRYEDFWKMTRAEQADHIWQHLFVDRAPLSEACRGVLTTLQKLGLDATDTPADWRRWCADQDPDDYVDHVMELSGVSSITMTNNVFDDNERDRWLAAPALLADSRFKPVLRLDDLLTHWSETAPKLAAWGYSVSQNITPDVLEELRRFLRDWICRMQAIYVAASLPPAWRYPDVPANPLGAAGTRILEQVVLPVCAEHNLPLALMIGCSRQVNPALREAGDFVGSSDLNSLANLCHAFPRNRFFVTLLSRENQHELAVAARKFPNLMPFGCWWFLNNPSLIEEITTLRFELLGTSFIPQHSDARILDQLLYKWDHSRAVIGRVLARQFQAQAAAGSPVSQSLIQSTISALFTDNFRMFLAG